MHKDPAIEIRECRDAALICDLLIRSIRDLCTADHQNSPDILGKWLANKTPAHVDTWLRSSSRFLLARLENEGQSPPAGVGCYHPRGEIVLNYVAPEHRFKGVSTALLAAMEDALEKNGVAHASLSSTRTAHRFYCARGWEDAGTPSIWNGVTGFPMQKALQDAPPS